MRAKKKVDTDETVLYIIGWILIGVVILIGAALRFLPELVEKFQLPCIFQLLTGLYCPGCGGTRAIVSLLRGDFVTSFLLHPFVPYVAVVGGWFMLTQTIQRASKGRLSVGMKYRDVYLWIALGLVAVNFLVKNILLINGIDVIAWALK